MCVLVTGHSFTLANQYFVALARIPSSPRVPGVTSTARTQTSAEEVLKGHSRCAFKYTAKRTRPDRRRRSKAA